MLRCFLECSSSFPTFFAFVQSLRLRMYCTFDSRLTPMAGWMHCGCFAKSKVLVDQPRHVLFPLNQHSFQSQLLPIHSLAFLFVNTSVVMNSTSMQLARKKAFRLSPLTDPFLSYPIFLGLISNMRHVECGGMIVLHEG